MKSPRILFPLLALLAVAAIARPAGAITSPNMWFDFDHDNNLATISRGTAATSDSCSMVLDLTGVSVTAPFTVTLSFNRNGYCLPNDGGECPGVNWDLMPLTSPSEVDSVTLVQVSRPCQPPIDQLVLYYHALPAAGPHVAVKVLMSIGDKPWCTNGNITNYTGAHVGSQTIGNGFSLKLVSTNNSASPNTWGALRRSYR